MSVTKKKTKSEGLPRPTFVKNKSGAGFTLIEILVVSAIIVVLSGIVMVGARSSEKSLLLERAAHQVANDIRLVLERTLQAVPNTSCTVPIFLGYGVHSEAGDSYIFFADCNGNRLYQNPPDKIEDTFQLPAGVRIKEVDPSPSFDLTFVPPEPGIFIRPGILTEGKIVLELISDTTKTKTITINERGAISID